MFHEAVRATEAASARKQPHSRYDRHRCIAAVAELEGQHTAPARHLPCGDFVPCMVGQPWIMHPFHCRVVLQEFRDSLGILTMRAHAPRKGTCEGGPSLVDGVES